MNIVRIEKKNDSQINCNIVRKNVSCIESDKLLMGVVYLIIDTNFYFVIPIREQIYPFIYC